MPRRVSSAGGCRTARAHRPAGQPAEEADSPPRSLATSTGDQRDLPLDRKYEPGATGAGIHTYTIDTGLDKGHPDFAGRVGEGFSVFGGDASDGHGHGTHVTGTIAGTQWGVAKSATIHAVRVLDAQGSGTDGDVIRGIDWVTGHVKANRWPAVANMSLGGSAAPALDQRCATRSPRESPMPSPPATTT